MLDVTWWSVFLTLRLPRLSPLLSPTVCLPLSICGVVDCEVLVLLLVLFHIFNIFITTFANMALYFSRNPGIIIFLSNCRGHQLVPQGKYVQLSNCHNNHAGVSVRPSSTHINLTCTLYMHTESSVSSV